LAGTAGVVVVALVAVGVIAAAPWDGSGGQAAPTSTAAPTTTASPATTAAPTTTVEDGAVAGVGDGEIPGYVFDPLPEGFALTSAWDGAKGETSAKGWAEVWAEPGATRASGRWFSLLLTPGWYPDYFGEATRIDVGGRTGYLRQQADGVLSLTVPVDYVGSNHALTITAAALTLDELSRLVMSVVVADVRPSGVMQPGFTDPALLDGLVQVGAEPSDQELLDRYLASWTGKHTSYSDGTREGYIEVFVGESGDSNEDLAPLALGAPPLDGPLLLGDLPDAADLTLGTVNAWSDEPLSLARWHDGSLVVTVVTTEPMRDLVSLLPRLRATNDREWTAVVRRANEAERQDVETDIPTGPFVDLGSGVLPDGDPWSAAFRRPEWFYLESPDFPISYPLRYIDRVMVSTLADYTLLVVSIDATSQATSARVVIGGTIVAEAPLVSPTDVDPTIEYAAELGVLAFDRPGVFTVEFVDAAGTVVDTYASPGAAP
jgi:hypothetical protein